MNKAFTLTTTIAAFSLLAGCAGVPSVPMGDRSYSEDNSRAYNLARAGGLREARDTKLGANEYSTVMGDMAGGAGTALALNSSAGFGLNGGASLGIGLASALLSGPGMMGYDSAFAFVPEREADSPVDAKEVIRDHFISAGQVAASENGFTLEVVPEALDARLNSSRNMLALGLVNEEIGCLSNDKASSGSEICSVGIIYPPQSQSLRETPYVAKGNAGTRSYPFYADKRTNSLQVVAKLSDELKASLGQEEAEQLRLGIMTSLSNTMPGWFYIYEKGRDTLPPMILNEGKAELFITQE